MAEITDPDILAQLNAQQGPSEVTDPALLNQLNAPKTIWDKLGETLPARIAKDIYAGVTLPGDVYSGKAQVNINDPEFIKRVTALGSVAPVGMVPSVTEAAPSVQQLIKTGGKQIGEAVDSGMMITQQQAQAGLDAIRANLPTRRVSEDTHSAIDALQQKIDSGQPLTMKDIADTRDELLAVQQNAAKSTSRTAATDLRSATIAKHGIDDIVRGTPMGDQFITGNANVAGGKSAETLDKRLYRSELRAAAANSGKNVGNTIRSNVASMLLSPKESGGLPQEARTAGENLVYGSGPENLMRSWGNKLAGGGGVAQSLLTLGAGGLGYLGSGGSPTITGLAALGVPVVGSLLKHGANELAISHLDALSNLLRSNTPLGATFNRGNYYAGSMPASAAAKAALIRALMSSTQDFNNQPNAEQ